jgi:hypothetical protein
MVYKKCSYFPNPAVGTRMDLLKEAMLTEKDPRGSSLVQRAGKREN